MANTPLYKVAPESSYPTWEEAGNAPVTNETVTGPLTAKYYYAYTKAYTTNADGSTQNNDRGYRVKLLVWFNNPNRTERTISCGVAMYMRRTDGYTSNNTIYLESNLSGKKTSVSKMFKTTSSWQRVITNQNSFNYDKNGNLTLTYSATGHNETGSLKELCNCTFTFQAPNIGSEDTKSTLSFSSLRANIGEPLTVNISKSANTKTTVKYKLLSGSDTSEVTIKTKITGTSFTWTPPLSLMNNISNANSVQATFYATTYNSSDASIGTTSETITLVVDTSKYRVNIDGKLQVSDTSGISTENGIYLKGVSILKLKLKPDMSNAYGATVKKIRATLPDGAEKTVSNPSLGGDGYYTLAFPDPIDTSGKNLTATFYVTDSRENETKYLTDPFEVLDYYLPAIDALTCLRGTVSGSSFTEDDEGTSVQIYYSASSKQIQSVGSGSLTIKISYRKTTEESYTNVTYTTPSNSNGTVSDKKVINLSQDYSYVIRVTVIDNNNKSVYKEANVSQAFTLLELNESGKGLSIGSVCTENGFTVSMDTKFLGKVYNSEGGVAITSDETKKKNMDSLIDTIDEGSLIEFYDQINPIQFQYKDSHDELYHFGFSAQEVMGALSCITTNPENFGIVEEVQTMDKKKQVERFLTLRYEEITPLNFFMIKLLLRELYNINKHIKELEENGQSGNHE